MTTSFNSASDSRIMTPQIHNQVMMVSPLPPSRCGLASYAEEHCQCLEAEGKETLTVSMLPDSHADIHLNLASVTSCLKSLLKVWRNRTPEVIVHYADGHFFPWRITCAMTRGICRVLQSVLLHLLARRSLQSLVIIHEIPTTLDQSRFNNWTREFALEAFGKIAFHTDSMREEFLLRFTRITREQTIVVEHTQFMRKRFEGTRAEARKKLALPASDLVLLCMGFLHESKGFHDAVTAFAQSNPENFMQLHLVGSAQSESPSAVAYAATLRTLCSQTPNVFLHEEYLDDTIFDTWLAAADVLLLPYIGVASSGVGARASLYGTDLIVRNLDALTEQFTKAETFETITELSGLIHQRVQVSATDTFS